MKPKKSLKKLDLSKEKISSLSPEELRSIEGGFAGSRLICTQSRADRGCTSHTRCGGGGGGSMAPRAPENNPSVTILCID